MLHSSTEVTHQLRGGISDTEGFSSSISPLTENIKPSFTKKLKFQSVVEGELVELKCKVVACPPPTILWFHNNKSIPKERRRRIFTGSQMHMHMTSLVIDSIKDKDSGSYKVMAINTEGSAESTASLLVSMRDEQSANYLSFLRHKKSHESMDSVSEQRKERKIRVDLRCVGSPFDKMSKVHRGRSRSQTSLVRSVYFRSGSHSKEKQSERKAKHLETASECAPSPPPMFDRSERFNDRFSDIYCDRHTGARFSDKFSDRCSDRYSERFSDTESLHNEVRTKLTSLQKAVKQKKRLSISTMSSSEFELESVASESSYADYVERLRVKPASMPDVQHFNRPFDLGESQREFPEKTPSSVSSQHRARHSFEPQSRTRAIQIMRGELVDTLVDKDVQSSVESPADVRFKQAVCEHPTVVAKELVETAKVEVSLHSGIMYPETTACTESRESVEEGVSLMDLPRPKPVTSILSEVVTSEHRAMTQAVEPSEECAGESLRGQYGKSLEADYEEKLQALQIRTWQQGSKMSEEGETFHPETDLPVHAEAQFREPAAHVYTQHKLGDERATVAPKVMPHSLQKSPKTKIKLGDLEAATVSTPKSPKIKARSEEVERYTLFPESATVEGRREELEGEAPIKQRSPRIKAQAAEVEAELLSGAEAREEDTLRDSLGPKQGRSSKARFLREPVTPGHTASDEPYQEECAGESLRAGYEKSLEAERIQCEEKLLALRIRKWQQGMQMSGEEAPYPESDLTMQVDTPYMEPEGQIYTEQGVVVKRALKDHAEQEQTSIPLPKARMRAEQKESEASAVPTQKSAGTKTRASKVEAQVSPRSKARAQEMLFEKTGEERELQLSRENISEFKNESERFASEEEALTQRIMKWQQGVLLEQEQAVKPESDWVKSHSPVQAERTTNVGKNVAVASALETTEQPDVVHSRKPCPGRTAKEKFLLSETFPAGFQDQPGESLQWLPTGELLTEGRETRLQRDSEYFVSEEEALAQRILKWQQDVVEQEEVVELESEWAPDNQQSSTGSPLESQLPQFDSEPHHGDVPNESHTSKFLPSSSTLVSRASSRKPSPLQQPPCESSSITSPAPTSAGLPHHMGELIESSYDLKSTPVKRTEPRTVDDITRMPFEGYDSACAESPRKSSRVFSSIERHFSSPQENVGREGRHSLDEYDVTADTVSSECYQSGARKDRQIQEDVGVTRETCGWRQQKDVEGVRREGKSRDSVESEQGDRAINGRRLQDSDLGRKTEKGEETCTRGSHPVFVKKISSVRVKVGEMSEFTCQFQGDPLPTVTWLKDGHSLAHNPDYDITSRADKSQLTVFYPTTDHQGTYDCVITNKHGKTFCSGTLEISDKKGVRMSRVTEELDRGQENQEAMIEKELMTYMESGKATLQVPQMVIERQRCSEEPFNTSPVEIRITAATPVPEIMGESSEAKPQAFSGKPSDVPTDEASSQTIRHKFTFSFDVAGEAPRIASKSENITCSEGNMARLECVITGEPTPEVTWYYENVILNMGTGKYRVEVDEKVHRLCIHSFTYSDAGRYKCIARNKFGEVTSTSSVSFQFAEPAISHTKDSVVQVKDKPRSSHGPPVVATKAKKYRPDVTEPPTISGCGLPASAAVIKVSQIKQAFESDSPVALPMPSLGEERKETLFPEEFLPAVAVSFDRQDRVLEPFRSAGDDDRHAAAAAVSLGSTEAYCAEAETGFAAVTSIPSSGQSVPPQHLAASKPVSSKTSQLSSHREDGNICSVSAGAEMGVVPERHGALKQFVEGVQDSPELIRPQPQRPADLPQQRNASELEMVKEEAVRTFDRTSSFIPFQTEKISTVKRSVKTSAPTKQTDAPKRTSGYFTPGRMEDPYSAGGASVSEDLTDQNTCTKQQVKGTGEENVFLTRVHHGNEEAKLSGEEGISMAEPSLDSGIFCSMPESKAEVTEIEEEVTGVVIKPQTQDKGKEKGIDVHVKPEPKTLTLMPKGDVSSGQLDLSQAAALAPQCQVTSTQQRSSLEKGSEAEARRTVAAFGSLEEEEVTFGAVYDYYNPPTDWGRPLSPESEMSIEIGSTVSEEIAEVAERFYTPGSSTGVSQPIAESFHTPMSPMSFHTPSSDTPGGFMTPQEYPFSPVEQKRPSTEGSSQRVISPFQFLTSPADEGIETTPPVDENRFLTKGRGSLSLATLQEKVQGIPPAFLKPLIKKRVFENDSLTFNAEVFGLPSPEVKWYCNKTQLVADDRVKMERDGDSISLTIHNVTKADQGEYICEAVNYVGEARSVALVVVVSQEVRFMPAPPAVTHQHVMEFDVEEDDSSRSPSPQEILLEVELDENEVREFEKQVKIITIPEYTADNKSMIISLDVLPSIYEEGAVDFVTQEHDDLKIAFEVTEMPPRFINPICDLETPEGTTVMFECSLMGIPSPVVSWFKGDEKISHNNKKYFHSSDGDNHFLKICTVSAQDNGVYTCRAINIVGETLCRASLVVLNSKTFSGKTRGRELTAVSLGSAKVQPQKFDLVVGNTSFDGDQVSEIELEFEFEQEVDESQRAVRLVANTDNQMSEHGKKYVSINFDVFAEPAKDDKVEFKGKSSDMCSFQFQVTESAPKCIIPLTDITAAVGTPVILQCLVSGKPNPTANWYKDGERITDSRCIIQEKTAGHFNLLITNVTQNDAGEYKCMIHNTAGCVETTALLKVF